MATIGFRDAASLLAIVTVLLPSLVKACNSPQSLSEAKTSLSCYRSTDGTIRNVDLLYIADSDEGHLWVGNGATPNCSSTSTPAPFACEVCAVKFVHVICCLLPNSTMPVMEGAGRHLALVQSECPQLLTEATQTKSGSANHSGGLPLIVSLFFILIISGS